MKKLLAVVLFFCSTTFAQNRNRNQPPAKVQQSFQKENTNPGKARWTQSNNQWHANYKDNNNRNVDAYYDRNGNHKDTHREIDKREVPPSVDQRINNTYHVNGNYTATKIERPYSQPLFQIKIQTGKSNHTVYMDEKGRNKPYNDHD